jgi:hypothetical protein
VYAGIDPITQRETRLKATAKTEQQAYIELGRLLKEASEGRTPESDITVAKLMDEYAAVAEWNVSTRQTNEGFIRRTIKPALGHMKVRKVRGPILDKLYAELKRCGELSACICGWSRSQVYGAANCAACRFVTLASTVAWSTSPSTTSSAAANASERTLRPTRTAGSPSTRIPAR